MQINNSKGDNIELNLYEAIISLFDVNELEDLCFKLDIDFESLKGETKEAKTRSLIGFVKRRGKLKHLLDLCKKARPNESWTFDTSVLDTKNPDKQTQHTVGQIQSHQLFLVAIPLLLKIYESFIYTYIYRGIFEDLLALGGRFFSPSIFTYGVITYYSGRSTKHTAIATLISSLAFISIETLGAIANPLPKFPINYGRNIFYGFLLVLPGALLAIRLKERNHTE